MSQHGCSGRSATSQFAMWLSSNKKKLFNRGSVTHPALSRLKAIHQRWCPGFRDHPAQEVTYFGVFRTRTRTQAQAVLARDRSPVETSTSTSTISLSTSTICGRLLSWTIPSAGLALHRRREKCPDEKKRSRRTRKKGPGAKREKIGAIRWIRF